MQWAWRNNAQVSRCLGCYGHDSLMNRTILAQSQRCSAITNNAKMEMSTDQKAKSERKPLPAFKYFINKSTVLGVYREALQLTRKFSDPDMRRDMSEMIKYEFEPFRKYSGKTQQDDEVQENIDYLLAKVR